ncbi:hypothetical protein [Candidatus Dactylopiibacterium carminicum]|uniref:hypothetical protein n=1 Tax=Candidatus Dactylopiibacterium carminicum TaxID=857335 RepID=UPI00295ECCE1|nr:hypothetical protein [Candidatus Dactylopiibacterium carminicum]
MRLAALYRQPGVLERGGAGQADAGEGQRLQARPAQFAMHHHGVAGHQLIGHRGAGGQAVDRAEILAERADRGGGELRVAHRVAAGGAVDGVMAVLDAVAAQHQAEGLGGFAADQTEYVLHLVVGNGVEGQEGGGTGDEDFSAHIATDARCPSPRGVQGAA